MLETLGGDVAGICEREGLKGLREISGVGEAIAKKIAEIVRTGTASMQ